MVDWRRRMKRYLGFVFLTLAVLSFSGCGRSAIEGYIDIAKEKGGISKEYLTVLNKWSRDQIIYSQFETKVRIAVTYKSREFQDAYAREYSRIYLLTQPEEKKKMDALAGLSADALEFFFYAYIPEKTQNDFAKQDSIWTIFLIGDKGERFYPIEVRQIEKVTPMVEAFYPYGNPYYGNYYTLRFKPLAADGKDPSGMKLIFTSVLGRIECEWKSE
jgi:hypothetical protein